MRLILDTHILLWALSDSRALSSRATALLVDPDNEKFASVASLWEIAIKFALGREGPNALPFGAITALELIGKAGLHMMAIAPDHAVAVETLPRHRHADPFDRLLVAQARSADMILMTHDAHLVPYGEHVLLV